MIRPVNHGIAMGLASLTLWLTFVGGKRLLFGSFNEYNTLWLSLYGTLTVWLIVKGTDWTNYYDKK